MPRDIAARDDRALPVDLLGLAATPTFAAMALLSAAYGGPADALCAAAPAALPMPGMAAMYALMAVFHAVPWLRRLAPITSNGEPR